MGRLLSIAAYQEGEIKLVLLFKEAVEQLHPRKGFIFRMSQTIIRMSALCHWNHLIYSDPTRLHTHSGI